ncbi:MAG: ATP-binding protein [Acutalibacteraceae bacterium]|nr:ATP-binding protein [Acutalibacteraceae bacterium]
MAYSNETYQKALEIINSRKQKAEFDAEVKKNALYSSHPEIEKLDAQMKIAAINAAKLSARFNLTEAAKQKEEFNKLAQKKAELFKKLEIDTLEPVYTCKKCNDTGFVDGLLCECAIAEARNIEFKTLGKTMPLKESTFEKFSLKYYKDIKTDQGNPLKVMTSIYNKCKTYADDFSPVHSGNLLFLGTTGLGKTHLSLAIAGTVINKGFGVVYASAQNIMSQIEKEHFGRAYSDYTNHICNCDLLIIDDLGAEFSTQFNLSAVYNIINTRMQSCKPTIISTNLEANDLQERYGQRIMSRIIGNFDTFRFIGNDIRQLKKIEKMKK